MKDINEQLFSFVQKYRISKKISQEHLADSLSINQSSYSRLESGKSQINLHQFLLLAEAIGTTPQELLKCLLEGNI